MNNNSQYDKTLDELVKSFAYMVESLKTSTKIYDGIVISNNNDGRWNIKYNGEIHPVKPYGTVLPSVDSIVKVIIPQGNQALSWFFINEGGGTGDGTTFIPSVSEEGIISWTNDGGLPNPEPVNIKGPQGDTGSQGPTGPQGSTGPYFTPSVDESGNLSWSNNGGLNNPTTVNIKGPQGEQGEQGMQGNVGPQGPQGLQGNPGYYFTPSVDAEGNLSWTNNGDLTNPSTVNIKGPQGIQGEQGSQGPQGEIGATGPQGPQGDAGPYFTPSVSSNGDLSWTNNGDLQNPTTVNIKGPQGEQGDQGATGPQGDTGPQGPAGKDGLTTSVNGVEQVDGNITLTLSDFGVTASVNEVNILDGVTATTQEINYLDGVTSNIQTQIDGKSDTITGGASTITTTNLTANRALVSNASGKVAVSAVTSTELGCLDGVTSSIQTQLNSKSSENIVSISLLAGSSNWTASGGYYYQNVSVSGMTANIIPYVLPNFALSNPSYSTLMENLNSILQVQSLANVVRIWASAPTTIALPLTVHYFD